MEGELWEAKKEEVKKGEEREKRRRVKNKVKSDSYTLHRSALNSVHSYQLCLPHLLE